MKENFKALMIGIVFFSNMISLMGWTVLPGRPTPTPTLIHMPALLLHTKISVEKYADKTVKEMTVRSR